MSFLYANVPMPYLPAPETFFASLSNAHSIAADHSQIMRHMRNYLLGHQMQVQAYSASICRYLRSNLQLNSHIVQTVTCLQFIHQYLSPQVRRLISATLTNKYPAQVCFFGQITALLAINSTLVEGFVRLMRGLSSWFIKEAQERDYFELPPEELHVIIESLYAEERYAFESGVRKEGDRQDQAILTLYRVVTNLSVTLKEQTWKKIIASLFYYFCMLGTAITPSSKYIFFAAGHIFQVQSTLMEAHQSMAGLIMRKARKAAQSNRPHQEEEVLRLLRNGIVNLLASRWTVELENFWLWRLKLVCDMLQVEEKLQVGLIHEVRQTARQICKFISSLE